MTDDEYIEELALIKAADRAGFERAREYSRQRLCLLDGPDSPNGPECWCGLPSAVQAGLCSEHAQEDVVDMKFITEMSTTEIDERLRAMGVNPEDAREAGKALADKLLSEAGKR